MDFFWIVIIGIAINISLVIAAIIIWIISTPIRPYLTAIRKQKDLLIVLGNDNRIRMIPVKISMNVHALSEPPFSFLEQMPRVYRLGAVNASVLYDGFGATTDKKRIGKELKWLAEQGVKNYEQLDEALRSGKLKESDVPQYLYDFVPVLDIMKYTQDPGDSQVESQRDELISQFLATLGISVFPESKNPTFWIMVGVFVLLALAFGTKILKMW